MKAAVLEKIGAPLAIRELMFSPELGHLSFGQVVVRVLVSGICGAQLQEIDGDKGNAAHLPHLLGHEGCGIVETTGPGVNRVRVGDKVVLHWRQTAGIDAACPRYHGEEGYVTGGKVTTFCERAVISENRMTPVPAETPAEFCALLGCGLSTALGTIESEARVRFGESVLIIGCGGLGLNLIMAAKMAQASPIVGMDIHATKQAPAKSMGATEFWGHLPQSGAADSSLSERRFDVIVDTVGHPETMREALHLLSGTGRYIMVGQPKPGAGIMIENARHLFEGEGKTIKATQGGRFEPARDIPRYVRLQASGLFDYERIVSHRLALAQVNEGIELVRSGQAGRVMLHLAEDATAAAPGPARPEPQAALESFISGKIPPHLHDHYRHDISLMTAGFYEGLKCARGGMKR